jgi:hypothetical protein
MSNEVIRQHYVPKTYLKHFSVRRSGEYYISNINKDNCNIDRIAEVNISNICLLKDLYTLPGSTTDERMLIEQFYSSQYEAHYDRIYRILIDPNKIIVSDLERTLIISTVVTMLYRTTKWLSEINEFYGSAFQRMYEMCKETGHNSFMFESQEISIAGKTLEQVQKEYKVDNRPSQIFAQLKVAHRLIDLRLIKDGIYVIKLDDDNCEFITSDNPVTLMNINGGHIAPFNPENILQLPLDNKHILLLMPYADHNTRNIIIRSNEKGAMSFTKKLTANYAQFLNSERFILGTKSGLASYISTKEKTERPISENEFKKLNTMNNLFQQFKDMGLFNNNNK